ncbi:MAG: tRNA (N(6)-L-threonylcarbamoyladenosine(37)-C(2))-methylthiotransferase MtaB [candidate division Zixibacteria bacterium RBG_16_50_21]|nr:MAG: tRNA (N(6)-L-threonylcarbamoyladenosine(37)-C(2))-methylthiotransferase MtaB [candidate division Zixibacteria bacterium RBG_16_50_21]
MRRVALTTLGCKLNQYETEAIACGLQKRGWQRVEFNQPADLYVIDTCTVTQQADYSSRQAIYQANRKAPEAKIVVTGCYAQIAKEQLQALPGVGLVVGSDYKDRLPDLIEEWYAGKTLEPNGNAFQEQKDFRVSTHTGHTRAFVKIQNGCQEWCAFCVIPMTRGQERSRPAPWIIDEIKSLVEKDYKEIVITGVHIGKYSWNGLGLAALLKKILQESEIPRIRLSSIKPKEVNQELIDLIASETRFCRHLHLPLQSGDSKVLSRMKRRYTLDEFDGMVRNFAERIPEVTLGTDLIVGFPGETEEEFANCCRYVESSPLSFLHVFSYSDRPHTEASALAEKIDPQTINKRSAVLRELGDQKWQAFQETFPGKTLPVLIESRREKQYNRLTGLADNYIRVNLDGPNDYFNQIVPVRILRRDSRILLGELAL